MQSREETSAQASFVMHPSGPSQVRVEHQEVSHVFYCMQCDLQFQMDLAVTSHGGSQEIDEGVICVRLDPCIKLEREA